MSQTHEQIMTEIQTYSEENGKFTEKGVKASATRVCDDLIAIIL